MEIQTFASVNDNKRTCGVIECTKFRHTEEDTKNTNLGRVGKQRQSTKASGSLELVEAIVKSFSKNTKRLSDMYVNSCRHELKNSRNNYKTIALLLLYTV